MAGDWLKFEKATLDKPEVFAIAADLGLDPDAVLGKLLRVWSWFDTHTESGNARRVTSALLDRIAGATGFTAAMVSVGWMEVTDDGVQQPGFDKHTGQSAKTRATTARRVAKSRSGNGECNGTGVTNDGTSALAREEKRREEVKAKATGQQADHGAGSDGDGQLPADIVPPKDPAGEKTKPARARKAQTAKRFPEFWAAYPVKKGRADAEKKWKAHGCDDFADEILAHVRLMERDDDQWKRGYIPHGSTYVSGQGWLDQPVKDKDLVHTTTPAPAPETFGAKAVAERNNTESALERSMAYIRHQFSLGAYGEGEEGEARMREAMQAAREKHGGAR